MKKRFSAEWRWHQVGDTTWKVSAPLGGANPLFIHARTEKWVILKALLSKAFKITFQVVSVSIAHPRNFQGFHPSMLAEVSPVPWREANLPGCVRIFERTGSTYASTVQLVTQAYFVRPLNPLILGDFHKSGSPKFGGWGA